MSLRQNIRYLLPLTLFLIRSAQGNCPAGFLELSGRCYLYNAEAATFAGASTTCGQMGASLAAIDDADTAVSGDRVKVTKMLCRG